MSDDAARFYRQFILEITIDLLREMREGNDRSLLHQGYAPAIIKRIGNTAARASDLHMLPEWYLNGIRNGSINPKKEK